MDKQNKPGKEKRGLVLLASILLVVNLFGLINAVNNSNLALILLTLCSIALCFGIILTQVHPPLK
jgi:hypothetical protein